jgi:Fe-S oxidoreductase
MNSDIRSGPKFLIFLHSLSQNAESSGCEKKRFSVSTKKRIWTQTCRRRCVENGPFSILPENPLRKVVAKWNAGLSVNKSENPIRSQIGRHQLRSRLLWSWEGQLRYCVCRMLLLHTCNVVKKLRSTAATAAILYLELLISVLQRYLESLILEEIADV